MPRANTPDHLKEYEVVCTGLASTKRLALYFLATDIKLNTQWIKGTATQGQVHVDPIVGGYRASCTLTFTDKRYAKVESTD